MSEKPIGWGAIDYESAFAMHRLVVPEEIDELGHVNNTVYVRWAQDIGVQHWMTMAAGPLADNHIWVCHRHEVDYRMPLFEGETVEIRTWLGARSGAKFDRHVDMRKAGAAKWSAQAKTTWVMLDKHTGKPKRIGDDVMAVFGLLTEDQET